MTDTWRLYLDGVLDRTLAAGGNFTPESTSIQHAALGSALTSNGTAAGFFQGAVDEVPDLERRPYRRPDPGRRGRRS